MTFAPAQLWVERARRCDTCIYLSDEDDGIPSKSSKLAQRDLGGAAACTFIVALALGGGWLAWGGDSKAGTAVHGRGAGGAAAHTPSQTAHTPQAGSCTTREPGAMCSMQAHGSVCACCERAVAAAAGTGHNTASVISHARHAGSAVLDSACASRSHAGAHTCCVCRASSALSSGLGLSCAA